MFRSGRTRPAYAKSSGLETLFVSDPWRATSSVRSNLDFGSDRDPWCDPNGHWAVSMRIRNAARNAPPGLTSWSPRPLVSAFVGAVIGSSAT